jgi:hypothetical protein
MLAPPVVCRWVVTEPSTAGELVATGLVVLCRRVFSDAAVGEAGEVLEASIFIGVIS